MPRGPPSDGAPWKSAKGKERLEDHDPSTDHSEGGRAPAPEPPRRGRAYPADSARGPARGARAGASVAGGEGSGWGGGSGQGGPQSTTAGASDAGGEGSGWGGGRRQGGSQHGPQRNAGVAPDAVAQALQKVTSLQQALLDSKIHNDHCKAILRAEGLGRSWAGVMGDEWSGFHKDMLDPDVDESAIAANVSFLINEPEQVSKLAKAWAADFASALHNIATSDDRAKAPNRKEQRREAARVAAAKLMSRVALYRCQWCVYRDLYDGCLTKKRPFAQLDIASQDPFCGWVTPSSSCSHTHPTRDALNACIPCVC